ncbi:Retrovirus-related Pol polyprotein from transposon TNT 1-94 [Scenedesmus sp. PABB004]|nr:Retrovirus-related Pol polyprotein from transposon TNT 1-94 [Scenedesmus sp. PABB004]
MQQPPGFEQGPPGFACKLRRSLYGLKQAPRAWNQRLHAELLAMGFTQSAADPAVYFIQHDSSFLILLVYVDDLLIATPRTDLVQRFNARLLAAFEGRCLGPVTCFLGILIERDRARRTLKISQARLISAILEKFELSDAKPRVLPLSPAARLSTADGDALDTAKFNYSALIGSIMYLAISTRPDIAYTVGLLSRFMAKPTTAHWEAARSTLRYLSGTADVGITYAGPDQHLVGFTDSDYAAKRQPTVAASTTEAEYLAAAAAVKEALWLRNLLRELGLHINTVHIHADNQSAIKLLLNPMSSSRSKHIDVAYHFAHERVTRGEVNFSYLPTGEMTADVLTKALPAAKLQRGLHTSSRPPAFVFDIDGVLLRGREPLPTAREAVARLCPHGTWSLPVCFLTNGGGVPEADKAAQLSSLLGVPVSEGQVVLSHTPMRALAGRLGQAPVLVVGRGDCARVARGYGFTKVLTTAELAAALPPGALPFAPAPPAPAARGGVCPVRELGWGSKAAPLAAVLVMADSADWYRDLQLLVDVISGHGVPTRQQPLPGSRGVEVFFSNPDLLWAAEYSRPRLGQGAFSTALTALLARLGVALDATFFGKPHAEPYRLAEALLAQQAVELGLARAADAEAALAGGGGAGGLFRAIFAVGDNPAADTRGANQAGAPWVSVLVRTGVHEGPGNCDHNPAHVLVQDVLAAVEAGLHRARSMRWHSLR